MVENFEVDTIKHGDFSGLPFIRLKETCDGQKGVALSLKHPAKDALNSKKKAFTCSYNPDPLSCFQTVMKLIEWKPPKELCDDPGDCCKFFRQPASGPQLKKWEAMGMPWKLNPHSSKSLVLI